MRKLWLALLFSSSLFSTSLYTLDNVQSLNLYFTSKAEFLSQENKTTIKSMITHKLEKAGFVFGKTDALIFVVKVDAIEIEGTQAIYLEVGLGEEVISKRKDKIETFAYTYLSNRFIEGYDPYKDTLESLTVLIDEFIDAHKDDNE